MRELPLLLAALATTSALPSPARPARSSRRAALTHAASFVALVHSVPAMAYAGEGSMPAEEVLKAAETLTPFQKAISLNAMTERPFVGKTTNGYGYDNKKTGVYTGAISGKPLFRSALTLDTEWHTRAFMRLA